ncbi:MAG: cobalamin B12-binding domain-containing protein [Candidatus Eisenbacteria bacterium]
MQRKIRVLVGKPGLDGHDRGAKVVAAALRDAGMEVVYTGLHQSADQIVEAAVQEDVDVVALSILSGAHMTLFPEVLEKMRERGIGDRLLSGGGIIPSEDMATLAEQGVGRLFGPGTSTRDIASYIHEEMAKKYGGDQLAPLAEPPALRAAEVVTHAEAARHTPKPAAQRPRAAASAASKPSRSAKGAKPAAKLAKPAAKRAKAPAKRVKPAAKRAKAPVKRAAPAKRRTGAKKKPAPRPAAKGTRRSR